jgi:hypothetical protein
MAERTKGNILRVETARAAAKTITAITAANPGVVTATAHGYTVGDIIYVSGVVGMTQVNDRAFVMHNTASPLPTGTFILKGEDTSGYTAYTSGGSAYKCTMTRVAEVTGLQIGGGGSQQIDVTNLESDFIEQLAGLPNLGTISLDITLNHTDTGQAAFRSLFSATTPKVVTVTTASGYVLCATGFASNQSVSSALNDALRGTLEFTVYRKLSFFA